MNIEEYNNKIKEINDRAKKETLSVKKEYALSNNTVKIGDIIEDHSGKGEVIKILFCDSNPPKCAYHVIECKKDGSRTKREKTRNIFQSNLKG